MLKSGHHLPEAGEAGLGVLGGLVALHLLLGQAQALGQVALGEPAGDPGPDECSG